MSARESGFGRLALLAIGIPILILAVIGGHTLGRFEENADRQRLSELEKRLDTVVAAVSENAWLLDGLRHRISLVRKPGPDKAGLEASFRDLAKRDGIGVRVYHYTGDRLTGAIPGGPTAPLFPRLMGLLQASGPAFLAGQREVRNELLARFGPGSRLEIIKRYRGVLVRFGRPGRSRGAYFWNDYPDGTGVIATIHRVPEAFERFQRLARRQITPSAGFAHLQKDLWAPPAGLSADQMRVAFGKCRAEGRLQTRHAGREWAFCQSQQGLLWCIAERVPDGSSAPWMHGLVIAALLLAGILLGCWLLARLDTAPGRRVIERLEALPMRFRLTALFLMATALPLGLALILGGIGVMDRTEVIATESGRHALDRLHRAETGYTRLVERFRIVSERLRDARTIREGRIELVQHAALRLQEHDIVQDIELRDGSAAPIFTTIDPLVKGSNQAIDMFSRIAIRRHAPNRIAGTADKVGANELIGEALLSSDDVGLASMLRSRGKVWTFKMGTNPTLWFWDVYPDQATGPAFFCSTNQLEWIYNSYLRLRAASQAETGTPRILSFRYGPDAAIDRFLPGLRGPDAAELRNAVIRSQESGRILSRSVRLGGEEHWVVIKPETVLGMHVFADLTPAADQLHALAPFRKRLALTAGLALLLSLLSASLLASLFLVPISDLGEGVSAIRRRDSGFRIPLRRPDEFGAVAAAFNKLLSEFEELEYGRVVQESLLPVDPEAPEGYEIRSFRRAATDLAGDYHDVVRLEDGRLAIVLGDVTGHGIAAALPMAMAKATVEFETIARWGYPGPLMGRLNALFNRELKPRQKFMTMASILLDPVKHTVEYDNAGHPYPLVYVAAEAASRELQLPSMPLGIRASRTSKPVRRELGAGDAILLYTDGLVECPGRVNGAPFGYDTLQRLFTSLCTRPGATSETILAGLVEALDAWRQEGPLPDDVTLLLLRRR